MRKRFFLVDCKTNEIVASVKIGAGMQVVYDDPPELRKGSRLIMVGLDCDIAMIALALLGYLIRPLFHVLMPLAGGAAALGLPLTYVGWWLKKGVKESGEGNQNKKRHPYNKYTPSVGPWKDPYDLSRDTAHISGKKNYYIVDSEANEIVDVIRLGKWEQVYIEWRGKRQTRNGKEGSA